MILTPGELRALTRKRRSDAQQRVLAAMGIDFAPRPDGTLAVSRALVNRLLGGEANAKVSVTIQPNWDALAATSKA